ncbi:unnamed protein product, partial [Cylicostephanus goldi]
MGYSSTSGLTTSVNFATLLAGCAFLGLVISMPILFTVMNNIEEELLAARLVYNEMADTMWKDLIYEGEMIRRTPRQTYREGFEVSKGEGAAGGGNGASNSNGGVGTGGGSEGSTGHGG